DRGHGAGDRDGGHLRGGGDGIRRGRTRPARLPVRARGGVRPADECGRGAETDGRGRRLTGSAVLDVVRIGAGRAFGDRGGGQDSKKRAERGSEEDLDEHHPSRPCFRAAILVYTVIP